MLIPIALSPSVAYSPMSPPFTSTYYCNNYCDPPEPYVIMREPLPLVTRRGIVANGSGGRHACF